LSRLVRVVFFAFLLPAILVTLVFALASAALAASPLIGDLLAPGADRVELFAIIWEEMAGDLLQNFLFFGVVAAPALALVGWPALWFLRRGPVVVLVNGIAGLAWGTFFDYYDSFFTGPGVEWDWPTAGAAYGVLVTLLSIALLRRR